MIKLFENIKKEEEERIDTIDAICFNKSDRERDHEFANN